MSITITGCILKDEQGWPAIRRIKIQNYTIIGDCPYCNSKSPTYACGIVTEGQHAGQVSVTFTGGLCDDTYYGCYDPVSGLFKIEVPESCPMPTLNVQFSNVQDVNCMQCGNPPVSTNGRSVTTGIASVINGIHTLEYKGNCVYEKYIPITGFVGSWIWGLGGWNTSCDPDPYPPNCNQPPQPSDWCYRVDRFHTILIRARLTDVGAKVSVTTDFASFWYSRGNCLCRSVVTGHNEPHNIDTTDCNQEHDGYYGYKIENGIMKIGYYMCNGHGRYPDNYYTWDYYPPNPRVIAFSEQTIPYTEGEGCGKAHTQVSGQNWILCVYEPVTVGGTVNVVY
jgi:hypothetical protein